MGKWQPACATCTASATQANFEKNDDSGAVEAQYKKLLLEIQGIYNNAKEFHSKVSCMA